MNNETPTNPVVLTPRVAFQSKGVGVFAVTACWLFLSAMVNAQIEPTVADQDILPLRAAIDAAVQHNFAIAIVRQDVNLARYSLDVEQAQFDVSFSFLTTLSERLSPSASSALDGADQPKTDGRTYSTGIGKLLPKGGRVDLTTALNRRGTNSSFARINPDFSSDISLSLRQPLLRGAGKQVNLASIVQAESEVEQSELALKEQVLNTIAGAESAYWNLAYRHARKDLLDSSLRVAEEFVRETREKQRLGLATKLDVLQAKAALAERKEAEILAVQDIDDAQDRLYLFMGTLALSNRRLQVQGLPEEDSEIPDFYVFYQRAREFNLERHFQNSVLVQRRLDVDVARNLKRPQLDFTFAGGLLGRDTDGAASYGDVFSSEGYNWRAGVELVVPWGLREGKARLRRAEVLLDREETRLLSIEQDLLLQFRGAWRALLAGKERLQATRATVDLSIEQFDGERAKYDAGLSTSRQVLEAQEDYDVARLRELDALIELRRSVVELERLDATLMQRHGFTWESTAGLEPVPGAATRGRKTRP